MTAPVGTPGKVLLLRPAMDAPPLPEAGAFERLRALKASPMACRQESQGTRQESSRIVGFCVLRRRQPRPNAGAFESHRTRNAPILDDSRRVPNDSCRRPRSGWLCPPKGFNADALGWVVLSTEGESRGARLYFPAPKRCPQAVRKHYALPSRACIVVYSFNIKSNCLSPGLSLTTTLSGFE